MSNRQIAGIFEQIAHLLEAQQASPHRLRAWRAGAAAVRRHPRDLGDLFREEGREGLERVPHIGRGLSAVIIEILRTGRTRALERLQGEMGPARLFADLPGIGEELAERIHERLGIDSLEELERAAHDGRLAELEGFGDKRVRAVQEVLASRLARARRQSGDDREPGPEPPAEEAPPVELLLELDRRYRQAAEAEQLPRIAPRRFNPGRQAWMPILHDDLGGWSFTALYSNTALAHELGKTHDWVVLYHERDGIEGRATVVTETRGRMRGLRVVRGREQECASHYQAEEAARAPGP